MLKKVTAILGACALTASLVWAGTDEVPGSILRLVQGENVKTLELGDHNNDGREDVYYIDGNGDIKVFTPSVESGIPTETQVYDLDNNWFKAINGGVVSGYNFNSANYSYVNDNIVSASSSQIQNFNEGYLVVTLPEPKALSLFKFYQRFYPYSGVVKYSIYGSNDGEAWTHLNGVLSRSIGESLSDGTRFTSVIIGQFPMNNIPVGEEVEIENNVAYTHYKFEFETTNLYFYISELQGFTKAE